MFLLLGGELTIYYRAVNSVTFHPDGTSLASASADQTIKVWDLRTNRLLQHYPAHTAAVTSFSFHPSGDFLLSGAADNSLKVLLFDTYE